MAEKGIRGGICHSSFYQYTKATKNYMKDYNENNESPCLWYWYVNNLYWWLLSQKLPANNFAWLEDTSQFKEDFIKNYNEEREKRYFIEDDV